jgi:tetratricopeptide (TPR) repeat protein
LLAAVAETPASLERNSLVWLREVGHAFCPELAAQAEEEAAHAVAQADDECRVWKNHARVQLALGEAYFDMLQIDEAEEPLRRARALLDARSRRTDCHVEAVTLALPNLLLAEIQAGKGDVDEAKRLLYYALSVLSQAGLSESTLTVNAMNTLVGVHLSTHSHEEAMWTCTRMVDVLAGMGGGSYRGMPIYADALGTLGTVHLNLQQPAEAERLFCEALEVAHRWLARTDWLEDAPFEHCQDLDIWLMEGLARACRDLGKVAQAEDHLAEAAAKRRDRGLAPARAAPDQSTSSPLATPGDSLGAAFTDDGLFSPDFGDAADGGGVLGGDLGSDARPLSPGLVDFGAGFAHEAAVARARSSVWIDNVSRRPYSRHIY